MRADGWYRDRQAGCARAILPSSQGIYSTLCLNCRPCWPALRPMRYIDSESATRGRLCRRTARIVGRVGVAATQRRAADLHRGR